jgi:hypothetical protein
MAWAEAPTPASSGESVEQALCRLIETASKAQNLPVTFFTRLIWQESSFRTDVVSRAGAQGVAQFMPGTARERGLADPFDPEQAIPASASLLADLQRRLGNLGLAAAAYNGGLTRVGNWMQGRGGLPLETRDYVIRITGRSAEDWSAEAKLQGPRLPSEAAPQSCLQVTADLRRRGGGFSSALIEAATAPWGVQLSGNFSKALALASYNRARNQYATVLASVQPMVIGTRIHSRGSRIYYRVRVPAQTRGEANGVCNRIHSLGGACVVLRS